MKNKILLILFLCTLLVTSFIMLSPEAEAAGEPTTVYIHRSKGDDSYAGTEDKPVLTLTKAFQLIEAGEANGAVGGKIILQSHYAIGDLNTTEISDDFNDYAVSPYGTRNKIGNFLRFPKLNGKLTITSENSRAHLFITHGSKNTDGGKKGYLLFQSPVEFTNIKLDFVNGHYNNSDKYNFDLFTGEHLTFGEGVETFVNSASLRGVGDSGDTNENETDTVSVLIRVGYYSWDGTAGISPITSGPRANCSFTMLSGTVSAVSVQLISEKREIVIINLLRPIPALHPQPSQSVERRRCWTAFRAAQQIETTMTAQF